MSKLTNYDVFACEIQISKVVALEIGQSCRAGGTEGETERERERVLQFVQQA